MITLPAHISDAERAVQAYKHELLVLVMGLIVRAAMAKFYISAADIPEDCVAKEHRQGVASNAWNSLTSLQIIERVPMALTDARWGIFGGRTINKNKGAKRRWVAVYRLRSRSAAFTWARANGVTLAHPAPINRPFQPDLVPA